MDSRSRYGPAPPLPPPPPGPHTPHTPLDARPPPPPAFSHPPASIHTSHPPPQPSYGGAQPAVVPGPSLPPIQTPYAAPGAPPDQHHLPPFRQAAHYPHEPPREGEYNAYNQHNRSGHVTPAPVNRPYSHDSAHQQRTPTTPAHPAQYPSASGPDGTALPPTPHHMEHGGYHGYPPTNGIPHGLPPPQHEQQHHYSPPLMESHPGYGPPPSQPMSYSQSYGPASANFVSVQKRKQMRATQVCARLKLLSALLTRPRRANSAVRESKNAMKGLRAPSARSRILTANIEILHRPSSFVVGCQ